MLAVGCACIDGSGNRALASDKAVFGNVCFLIADRT
jgi:hypothetical protein